MFEFFFFFFPSFFIIIFLTQHKQTHPRACSLQWAKHISLRKLCPALNYSNMGITTPLIVGAQSL